MRELDIPAPDMGTDEETMAWFYDAYGLQHGDQPGLVAIQGFGNVASYAAERLREHGARIVAVFDSGGGCFDADGLDVTGIENRRDRARAEGERLSVAEAVQGADKLTTDELLALDVDILIPAAIEYVIDADNADAVDVLRGMDQRMRVAWERLCDVADSDDCGYRQAAFNIAVERINTAISYRGV